MQHDKNAITMPEYRFTLQRTLTAVYAEEATSPAVDNEGVWCRGICLLRRSKLLEVGHTKEISFVHRDPERSGASSTAISIASQTTQA